MKLLISIFSLVVASIMTLFNLNSKLEVSFLKDFDIRIGDSPTQVEEKLGCEFEDCYEQTHSGETVYKTSTLILKYESDLIFYFRSNKELIGVECMFHQSSSDIQEIASKMTEWIAQQNKGKKGYYEDIINSNNTNEYCISIGIKNGAVRIAYNITINGDILTVTCDIIR